MVAKIKNVYVCQQCGYESLKWLGRCPSCSAWNSMVEEQKNSKPERAAVISSSSSPKSIVNIISGEKERYDTGIEELNRVLGGGLVKGSLTLISGDPGIGKSTLLLQTANNIATKYGKILYASGEESEEQIKIRGDRLGVSTDNLYIVSETNMDIIARYVEDMQPVFVIIDSIQTMYKDTVSSAPGSVSQVRECSNELMRIGKNNGIPLFIVAHVTKQGELAGPRVLEHMVDTVLTFQGERTEDFRVLRTVKNRFGTTSEIGVFEMSQKGLIEVYDPSGLFLQDTNYNQEGSTIIGIMEGTRPLLVEVQSLVTETKIPVPRRTAVGIENSRLSLILAVLEKKLRIYFYNSDVYVNVVGGMNLEGTTPDLGIALSLVSSIKGNVSKLERLVAVGEIGLTGEIRPVANCDRIVNEAKKLGFKNIIVPYRNIERLETKGINIIGVSTLKEAINKVF